MADATRSGDADPTRPAEPGRVDGPGSRPAGDGPEPAGYAEALSELDDILAALEDPDLDVDRVSGHVRRAARLVAFCRERIAGARLEVEAITDVDGS